MVAGRLDRQRPQGTYGNCLGDQMMTDRGDGVQIWHTPGELDPATAGSLTARGCAAIARHARLLLLDLTGLSFCDAPAGPGVHRAALCHPMKGCRHEHRP
jgi:hypothetical protein